MTKVKLTEWTHLKQQQQYQKRQTERENDRSLEWIDISTVKTYYQSSNRWVIAFYL